MTTEPRTLRELAEVAVEQIWALEVGEGPRDAVSKGDFERYVQIVIDTFAAAERGTEPRMLRELADAIVKEMVEVTSRWGNDDYVWISAAKHIVRKNLIGENYNDEAAEGTSQPQDAREAQLVEALTELEAVCMSAAGKLSLQLGSDSPTMHKLHDACSKARAALKGTPR